MGDSKQRYSEFRTRFCALRFEKGMVQKEFAAFLGISRATVGQYESGKRIPNADGVKAIAEKCGVSADWLIGLSDAKNPDATIQAICKYTHLSEEALETLKDMDRDTVQTVNCIIMFPELLELVQQMIKTFRILGPDLIGGKF